MLASSPSPSSAVFRSGLPSTSSSSPPPPPPPPQSQPQPLSQTSPPASHRPRDENSGPPPSVSGTRQFSPHSPRVAVEELRSALNRHTVESASPGPSGDLARGRSSAGQTSLEGGSPEGPANSSSPRSSNQPTSIPAAGAGSSAAASMPVTTTTGSSKRSGQGEPVDNVAAGMSGNSGLAVSQPKRLRATAPNAKLLPERYDLANTSDIVVLISSMLIELIQLNDKIPLHEGRLTRFHSRSPPRISVHDYLQRLTTHATLSPPILLSMVYYIDRLCALYPAFTVSSLTIHRFLISSATVASKGLSDSFWTNKTYARVGGISMTELALLELEFLIRVEWRIVPQPEVLVDYYQSLVARCDGYEIERGPSN
ncbi:hypothetical protein PHISP_04103 [Aspergillus sp. HF37]|nr:hypothetical protein PHISP_04103 [Aspergillus sp. HF37]